MLTREIELIKNQFVSRLSPKRIYLFGSFAEGRETEDSDYDFYIVVADGTGNLVDLTVEAYKSIRHVRTRAVDIIIGTENRFEGRKFKMGLEHEVMRKGVLLYAA